MFNHLQLTNKYICFISFRQQLRNKFIRFSSFLHQFLGNTLHFFVPSIVEEKYIQFSPFLRQLRDDCIHFLRSCDCQGTNTFVFLCSFDSLGAKQIQICFSWFFQQLRYENICFSHLRSHFHYLRLSFHFVPATARTLATVWMQATAVTQAITVMLTISNIKDDCNIMTAHNSRNASKSRTESNNRTANTVQTLSKAGFLSKTVKPTTAWREATAAETRGISQHQQQKGDPQQQYQHQQGCQQHNMNAHNLFVLAEICQKVIRTAENQ